jgi:hypothetical protein
MAERSSACWKCDGEMTQGFVVDKTHGGVAVGEWGPGAPTASFWTGTKRPTESLPIGAFRCSSCGYLEFYAGEEFGRQ